MMDPGKVKIVKMVVAVIGIGGMIFFTLLPLFYTL